MRNLLRSWLLLGRLLSQSGSLIAACMFEGPLIEGPFTEQLSLNCLRVSLLVPLERLKDLEGVAEVDPRDLRVFLVRQCRHSVLLLSTSEQALEVSHLKD